MTHLLHAGHLFPREGGALSRHGGLSTTFSGKSGATCRESCPFWSRAVCHWDGVPGEGQVERTNCALKNRNICFLAYCGDSRVRFTFSELLGLRCFLASLHVPPHAKPTKENRRILLSDTPEKRVDFEYKISQNIVCLHFPHRISVNSFKTVLSATCHPAPLLSAGLFLLSSTAYLLLCSFA